MAVGLNIGIVGDPTELTAFETRHVPGALKLSQEMGWPYRIEDWEFAARVGEGLVLERSGEVIGAAMWWNYGQAYASAGMIIVTASAQGGGYGSRLFNGLLESTDGRNVLLNSTEEGLTLYRRRGFTEWGAVHQHQGKLNLAVAARSYHDIRPATVSDLPAIKAFDERATGMPRGPMVARARRCGRRGGDRARWTGRGLRDLQEVRARLRCRSSGRRKRRRRATPDPRPAFEAPRPVRAHRRLC